MVADSEAGEVLAEPVISDVATNRQQERLRPLYKSFGSLDNLGNVPQEILQSNLEDVMVSDT